MELQIYNTMGKLRNLNIILFSMKRVIFNFILFSKGKQYATLTPEPTLKGTYSEKQLFLWATTKGQNQKRVHAR